MMVRGSPGRVGTLIILIFVFAIGFTVSSAAPGFQIIVPGIDGVTVPGSDDFASEVLGDPWDMQKSTDLGRLSPLYSNLTDMVFADGIFSADVSSSGDGQVYLMEPGYRGALHIGRDGYAHPIDPCYYRYFVARIKVDQTPDWSQVYWFYSDEFLQGKWGSSRGLLTVDSGWQILMIDLQAEGAGEGNTSWCDGSGDVIRGLRFDPSVHASLPIEIDWVRLLPNNPHTESISNVELQWIGSDNIHLYACRGETGCLPPDVNSYDLGLQNGYEMVWQVDDMESGDYYIGAQDLDTGSWDWGAAPVRINRPPVVKLLSSSKVSGKDFATTVLGNPWDMSDSGDILPVSGDHATDGSYCLSTVNFSESILSITPGVCINDYHVNDPRLGLNVADQTIDTSYYRYFSIRWRITDSYQDVLHGWISRIYWWQKDIPNNRLGDEGISQGKDIIVDEGWNVYSVDLTVAEMRDEVNPCGVYPCKSWLAAAPNMMRFDPVEYPRSDTPDPATLHFEIDWIKLTALEEVVGGQPFAVRYTLNKTDPINLTFCYDNDTDAQNGCIPMAQYNPPAAPPPSPTLTEHIYLPLVAYNWSSGGDIFHWDTTSVAPGTYWIGVTADDGYNETTWYSDAPMKVLSQQ